MDLGLGIFERGKYYFTAELCKTHLQTLDNFERGIPCDIANKYSRVATVRENYQENEIFFRLGKSEGILWMVREI